LPQALLLSGMRQNCVGSLVCTCCASIKATSVFAAESVPTNPDSLWVIMPNVLVQDKGTPCQRIS